MNAKLVAAAKAMDWGQVLLNAAPPCFHLCEDGCFCGRAEVWHDAPADHKFTPLASLLVGNSDSGLALIASERQRQITEEGWTAEHDDQHCHGELAEAAACYALVGKITAENAIIRTFRAHEESGKAVLDDYPMWPWGFSWWKPTGDPIGDLTKAGALIAAELDRLLRGSIQPETGYSVHYSPCPYEHGGACTCKPQS